MRINLLLFKNGDISAMVGLILKSRYGTNQPQVKRVLHMFFSTDTQPDACIRMDRFYIIHCSM